MKNLLTLLFLFCFFSKSLSQDNTIHITKPPPEGVSLDKGWRFQGGDNPDYSKPDFNDQNWMPIDPSKDIRDIPELWKTNIVWFRFHFILDSSIAQKALAVLVEQTGASEVFLNGQLIQKFGTISNNSEQVQAVTPIRGTYIGLPASNSEEQVLAVRFAVQRDLPYVIVAGRQNRAFALEAMEIQSVSHYFSRNLHLFLDYMRGGVFFVLSILHLALFWFNPSQKANLYFFIYAILVAVFSFLISLVYTHVYLAITKQFFLITVNTAWALSYLYFLSAVYEIFDHRRGMIYWALMVVCLSSPLLFFIYYHKGHIFSENVLPMLIFLEVTRITILAAKSKRRGAKIVIAGTAGYLIFYLLFGLFGFDYLPAGVNMLYAHLALNISFLILPVTISIYLALESSFTSHLLTQKLDEVQRLSQQTVEQEKEKQQILAIQKDTLEQQVQERTAELKESLSNLKSTQSQLMQQEKMASLGQLTAGIAHEIQNPLNFVNNFSEVSVELIDELKQEAREGNKEEVMAIADDISGNLEKVVAHGKRADSIVKSMMEHSRTSKGEMQLTDINALADEYLRLAYHGMRGKDKSFNATLETHSDDSIGKIKVVLPDIGRVLLNLYNNAFYAVAEKKKQLGDKYEAVVSVTTRKENDKVIISVRDNGNGIPEKVRDKIFQPFFTTKPTGQGTGLGLSLSYDIIKAHGGEIKVETKEDEGAEFIVALPQRTLLS